MSDSDRPGRLPEIRTLANADFYLPAEVERLRDLAYNLWWTWQPEARLLFSNIEPALWARYRNPIEVLLNLEPSDWEKLLVSDAFRATYERVLRAFDRALDPARPTWFERTHRDQPVGPIAYLSMEYGIHECLGIYSGGLGVLSGDHCKSASDLGLPFVAVGLLYRRGYFHQTIDAEGRQQHIYPDFDFTRLPIQPVLDRHGRALVVDVPLLDHDVHLAVYKAQVGRVPLLLLTSDLQQNRPEDRRITDILYVRGREMRLCQEILLGVGGVRALRAAGIEPRVWHLNEGHVALAQLERLREEVEQRGESWARAIESVRRNVAFTTHTPVPAGNETFDVDLARTYLAPWSVRLGVGTDEILALGQGTGDDPSFNMTAFALRLSAFRNGVSVKHAEVSREMWRGLFGEEEPPIEAITNGVHLPTWVGLEMRDVLRHDQGGDLHETIASPSCWSELDIRASDDDLWDAHRAQKIRLIRAARENLRRMFARHGESPRTLAAVGQMLDPEALTIGFARRFATYKRAGLLFTDRERLARIVGNEQRPVQFLFAGKAHPADLEGQKLIEEIFRLSAEERFRGRIVFLEDYDIRLGRLLTQGVDAWLNNPRRPLEASGTSGQKAGVNGALNVSVRDGWWAEGFSEAVGWAIGGLEPIENEDEERTADAESLYALLENEIVPLFYERDEEGLPRAWIARMRHSIRELAPRFCSSRMVLDYAERAYLPLARAVLV